MKISAEERDIIQKILDHAEAGTTDMTPDLMRNPVEYYASKEQLEREVKVLFREFPLILGHSSDLPDPGSFLTNDDTGMPLLITRNEQGVVRAFLNVCRHRGARVEDRPCGTSKTFSCPYHSWTYDNNGALRGFPGAKGFEGIDKGDFGLVEVPAFERFGMIFVRPSPQDTPLDIDAWLAPLTEQLGGLDMGSHVIFERWKLERKMNWRLALEGFQESYHFCHAHRDTACSNYLDNQSVYLQKYPHVRHSVPLPVIERLRDQKPEEWDYRPYFMTQNFIFPANFIQVMTDHIYVHTILPTGHGTCTFQCMMLIPEAPQSEKAERYWRKNYEVVREVFNEDFEIGESIQKGLDSGANESFLFGKYECCLHYSQTAITDALEGRLRA
jgi:phenylpropionate dioxygenase-like ring-hydroxylating dioxygenase large terminal subunit